MSLKNCESCNDLRNDAPNFIVNGFTDTEVNSLKNNTGLNPSNANNDCTDLNNMNDCLIGNMEAEVDAYNVCDWKPFMKSFIPNVWSVFKGIISAICGLWIQVEKLWIRVEKHDCEIAYLNTGATFSFGENTQGKQSVLVPGKGVDFSLRSSSDEHASDVSIRYLGGALGRIGGSLYTFIENFTDANGNSKAGNSAWNFSSNNFDLPNGGELLYEIRIKKSEYPQIKRIYNGSAFASGGGNRFFQARIVVFDGDNTSASEPTVYAYGQHGWCNTDGTPTESGYDRGHAVPSGWIYVQVRMYYVASIGVGDRTDGAGATKQGSSFSPDGYMGIRVDLERIGC